MQGSQAAAPLRETLKSRRRRIANMVAENRNDEPDARTKFAIIQEKRLEAEARGEKFQNRIDEKGAWV